MPVRVRVAMKGDLATKPLRLGIPKFAVRRRGPAQSRRGNVVMATRCLAIVAPGR